MNLVTTFFLCVCVCVTEFLLFRFRECKETNVRLLPSFRCETEGSSSLFFFGFTFRLNFAALDGNGSPQTGARRRRRRRTPIRTRKSRSTRTKFSTLTASRRRRRRRRRRRPNRLNQVKQVSSFHWVSLDIIVFFWVLLGV